MGVLSSFPHTFCFPCKEGLYDEVPQRGLGESIRFFTPAGAPDGATNGAAIVPTTVVGLP